MSWRTSLASRLLMTIGLATILPLTLVTVGVLTQAYSAASTQMYAAIEETSHRYAADFQSQLLQNLGLLQAIALYPPPSGDQTWVGRLLHDQPDLRDAWILRKGDDLTTAPPDRRDLFRTVEASRLEALSEPDYQQNQATLAVPILEDGQFRGVVAVSFSLKYFQSVVTNVHLYKTGYAFMVSHAGYRIAHPSQALIGQRIGNDLDSERARTLLAQVDAGQAFSLEKKALFTGTWSRQYYSPVQAGRAKNPWFFVVVVPVEEATAPLNNLFFLLVLGAMITVAFVVGTTWATTRSVVRPLRQLAVGAEAIANGELDTRVEWASVDEIGILARAFNHMTDRLVETLRNRESEVRQRTASLEQSLANLETAQAKIIESEKMAVLGQLTAAMAHEINTPLGAIRSSATFLLQTLGQSALSNAATLDSEEQALYKQLIEGIMSLSPSDPRGSDRSRRKTLASALAARRLTDPESLAEELADLITQSREQEILALLRPGSEATVRLAASQMVMIRSAAIAVEAADRAASTVSALVAYARREDRLTVQPIDPARELDTILQLYYNATKKNVVVVREWEPGVLLHGDRDRLNQIWVNLINNALDAMQGRGQLVLRIRRQGQGFEVAVANDGPTIPEELRDRIFEPFFTTKKAGEGTGLGLDICRRIAEAHGGSLTLSQERQFTVFTVWLPETPANRE